MFHSPLKRANLIRNFPNSNISDVIAINTSSVQYCTCIFREHKIFAILLAKLNTRKFFCIEYQLFCDMICNILARFKENNNTRQISIITFVIKINWKIRKIKMQQIFYINRKIKMRRKNSVFTVPYASTVYDTHNFTTITCSGNIYCSRASSINCSITDKCLQLTDSIQRFTCAFISNVCTLPVICSFSSV